MAVRIHDRRSLDAARGTTVLVFGRGPSGWILNYHTFITYPVEKPYCYDVYCEVIFFLILKDSIKYKEIKIVNTKFLLFNIFMCQMVVFFYIGYSQCNTRK